jgi:ubiquinone/menaquinone biosynthesis C-methylase UbiE
VVQTGQPAVSLPDLLHDHPEFADCYIHGMADISRRAARELAATIDLEPVRDVLDVGGGGGVYAEALAERSPSLNIVLLDLAPTLKIAAERLAHSPHRHRIQLREGDYHHADFGAGAFDLVLFSHVMHDEGEDENKSLLNKALLSLRRGGTVVIHDFMAPGPGPGPLFPALFSLHMLVYTQKGRAYRADEYQTWLREGGWVKPRRVAICTDRPTATTAILAGKP